MKNIGFLFDLDGVLIDSESEYTKIWEKIEQKYPTGVENFAIKIKGTTLNDILDKYFNDIKIRPAVEEMLYKLEKQMVYKYSPGARDVLMTLRENKIPIALVTSSNSDKMAHLYNDIPELKDFFSTIIVGEMVTYSKPDPEGYLRAAAELNLSPNHCAVVEDSLQGVRAGKAASALVVGIAGTLPADTLKQESDIVVDGIADLPIFKIIEDLRLR